MRTHREYTTYSVHDFVMDDFFRQWVQQPTANTDSFWNAWLSGHPEKRALIEEARLIVQHVSFPVEPMPQESIHKIWEKLEQAYDNKHQQSGKQALRRSVYSMPKNRPGLWYAVAAAVLVLLMASAIVYFVSVPAGATISYTTPYGQTKTVLLPDSSTVTLNANSSLRFSRSWKGVEIREVWLQGEAYFNVMKKKSQRSYKKFIVHTGPLHVEVLGTTFTVNNRHGNTKVVLNTGKIKLASTEAQLASPLIMQPGEYVEYSGKARKLTRKRVNPAKYSSWTQDKLIFDNTPLHEVAQLLEDNFGLKVLISNESLANRGFTATLPATNVQTLLTVLQETFGIKITRQDNLVVLDTP